MRRTYLAALALALFATAGARASEPEKCRVVRLAEIGWTDVTATTATVALLLRDLGYQTRVPVLSVPMAFRALKDNEADAFLGDWEPPMAADRRAYLDEKSIDVLGVNLTGAKYTLAVPHYVWLHGLRDFADIRKYGAALGWTLHGIEPGNDGNRFVLALIKRNRFGLGRFHLVQDTQQAMLADVDAAYRARKPIVFIGWAPHPMNAQYEMDYLTGGDDSFGPDFGGASVYTTTRAGYAAECPNVARLLGNLKFDIESEAALMDLILTTKLDPTRAAARWLGRNKPVVRTWLTSVTTFDGGPALEAVERAP